MVADQEYGELFLDGGEDLDRPLPEHLVNVDFSDEARKIGRQMGCLIRPRTEKPGDHCPLFGERFKDLIIPRSDWLDILEQEQPNYAKHKFWQYDQNGEGTCTSNATGGCISYCWSKQFGKQFGIAPAPLSCYKRCARGPNTGSTTGCNLRCARDTGMLLIDNASNRKIMEGMGLDTSHMMRAVGYRQASFPRGWEETAGFFRIDEYYEINSVDEFFTALLYGYDILYGRAGHAIHGVDLVYRNRDFYCKYDNSWGRWGDKGFGYDSLDYVRRRGGAYGAYAVKHVRTPDEQIQKLMGIPEFAQAV